MGEDPNALPYPPSYWPTFRFWQFANRHNPYLAVGTRARRRPARPKRARRRRGDRAPRRAGPQGADAVVPGHQPGGDDGLADLPVPLRHVDAGGDQGQLKLLTSTILDLVATPFPPVPQLTGAELGEQIALPAALAAGQPLHLPAADRDRRRIGARSSWTWRRLRSTIGQVVTNLAPEPGDQRRRATAHVPTDALPLRAVVQDSAPSAAGTTVTEYTRQLQRIYGFSVFNPSTGEAYIVEVVGTDLTVPDQLPRATQDTTYDPFYVRVVFLNRLTAYSMSIIVPSMARDQYNYLAQPLTVYQNVISKTNELRSRLRVPGRRRRRRRLRPAGVRPDLHRRSAPATRPTSTPTCRTLLRRRASGPRRRSRAGG